MKKLFLPILALAALMLVLGGCSSSTDPVDATADLEDFGSYKATDEAPYFGNPVIAAEVTEGELDYDDPVALSPIVADVEALEVPDIFCFRMVWGNLERDSGITELTDWSGTLTVSRGAIVVKRLIWFEPLQDYLLPRWNDEGFYVPEELRWVSQTSWHIDGIATKLFFPPSVTDEVVTVSYESPQLSISFTMDELETLDTLVFISAGNSISFQACRFDPVSRLHGALAGRWTTDEEGKGIFYGKWISAAGLIAGAVEGEWGIDENGKPVFVGKWIDNSGQFEGLLKGFWRMRGQGARAAGQFWGRIFDADSEPIGILHGHFKRGLENEGGYFAGRWRLGGKIPSVISANDPFIEE